MPSTCHKRSFDESSSDDQATTSTSSIMTGLNGLPQEISDKIANHLDVASLFNLSLTSKAAYDAIADTHLKPLRTVIDSGSRYTDKEILFPTNCLKEASWAIENYLEEAPKCLSMESIRSPIPSMVKLAEERKREAEKITSVSFWIRDSETQARLYQPSKQHNLGIYESMANWDFTLPSHVSSIHFAIDEPYIPGTPLTRKVKNTIESLVKSPSVDTLSVSTLPNVFDVGWVKNLNVLEYLGSKNGTLIFDQQSGGMLVPGPDSIPKDVSELRLKKGQCPARIVFHTFTPRGESFHLTLPRDNTWTTEADTRYASFDQYVQEIARASRLGDRDTEFIITGIERWSDDWFPKETVSGGDRASYVERELKKAIEMAFGESEDEEKQ